MEKNPLHVPAKIVIPVVLAAAIVPIASYTNHLCACIHPIAAIVGKMDPLDLGDDVIRQRLQKRWPVGQPRDESLAFLKGLSSGSTYEKSCRTPSEDKLACDFVLQADWIGLRKRGLSLAIYFNSGKSVGNIEVARFTQYAWD